VGYTAENVRVNAAAPGMIMTPRVAARECAGRVEELSDRHLLGFGVPEDVARMAVNLASDESWIVTGQLLSVDSGISIS
jgi:NAD(P)-dependent dehydrogenase (short-subunit alcohol dehydrogenase family)